MASHTLSVEMKCIHCHRRKVENTKHKMCRNVVAVFGYNVC